MNLKQEIDEFVKSLPIISDNREYWLVRTQSGFYYDTFFKNKFIGIEYDEISYSVISQLKKDNPDQTDFISGLKKLVKKSYPEESHPGLIAGQISKFIYEIKKDDIVLIPSENSRSIAIGVVTETPIQIATETDMLRTDCDYTFRKKIRWIKVLDRDSLDPYLYKVLFAHQAINNLKPYSEFIERSLNNFFVKDGEAHLVLDIEKEGEIYAKELFGLGLGYLDFLDEISQHFKLEVSSNEIEVKITLNSPGKIHFKAPKWSTVVFFGLAIIAINGGGLKINQGSFSFDLSTNGIIKTITDYKNNEHDRNMQDSIYMQYKDSLKVKQPDELIRLLQQSSTNKDLPK